MAKELPDPDICDRVRYGDDLLARISALTAGKLHEQSSGNGWRWVLYAAGEEIRRLRIELTIIREAVSFAERKWS